jgi:hypothetical protein
MPQARKADSGGGAFAQHVSAEPEQLRRPAACLPAEAGGAFYEPAVFQQAAKVLLVQPDSRKSLQDPLKLKQGKFGWEQFEHYRPVF